MNQLPKNVAFIARDSGSKRKEKYIFYHFFEAEKFQAAKAYYNALLHWNKVLSHVPAGIDLSYVYMQRSKIYEDSSLPAECLNNNFLSHSLNTYDVEKIKVRQILRECSEANSFMELSYKANPKMPFVIDGLKLKCDTAFGLHVIAEHVLNIGDIICVENALFTFLTSKSNDINFEKNSSYQRCHHCLISTKMDMVSCMECKTMYCSMTCKDKAMKVYHKYECFIIYHYHHNKDIFLTLRPFFFGLYIFDGDFNKMKSFFDVNNTIEGMKTVFDYDLSNPISEDYAMNLMTVFDSYKAKENNKLVQTEIKMIFESHNDLKAMWNGNEIIIVKMLSRYADILRELAHPIVQWPANTKQLINQLPPTTNQFQLFESNLVYKMVGVGYYPFLGLLNHSCVPNIYRHVNEKNQMMLIVCRPIQKGQQLFVDYNGNLSFCKMTRAKRLQELMRHHNFLCTCPACTTDLYPLINKQASNNNKEVLEIARIAAEGIKDWNREVARDKYLFFIQLLQEHHTTLPTRELSILHQWSLIVLATTTRPDESF